MDDNLLERIFKGIDKNSARIDDVTEEVHRQSGYIGIINKVFVGIVIGLSITCAAALIKYTLFSNSSNHQTPPAIQTPLHNPRSIAPEVENDE